MMTDELSRCKVTCSVGPAEHLASQCVGMFCDGLQNFEANGHVTKS